MQCDLRSPSAEIPLGAGQVGSPPVLVMSAGYSRMLFAVMIPTRQAPDLILGHWELLTQMGAVPRELVWDNEGAVGSWRGGAPKLAEEFEAFRGILGVAVHQCRPRDPEAKGLVERTNGYFESSFLPGRTFTSAADFNDQLTTWLVRANARHHRSLGCRPADRWAVDAAAMVALPPVTPALGWRLTTRLPRDHYVRLDANDYSVDPAAVGRKVEVTANLTSVAVTWAGRLIARHERCWAALLGHAQAPRCRFASPPDPSRHTTAVASTACGAATFGWDVPSRNACRGRRLESEQVSTTTAQSSRVVDRARPRDCGWVCSVPGDGHTSVLEVGAGLGDD
nr:integrase core domain-containing protein [Cellulomonas sp. KRMCY2]